MTNLGNIRCLNTKGGSLPDKGLLLLDEVSQVMFEKKQMRAKLLFIDAEVAVMTQFHYRALGSFCGVEFDAQLDIQDRTYRVTYLVNPRISTTPCEFVSEGFVSEEELFSLN